MTMAYRNGDAYETCEHGYSDTTMCSECTLATLPTVERYTTAPDEYDGFGTRTLEWLPWVTSREYGHRYRKVAILVEHEGWQIGRYGSGMYPAWEAAKFQELVDYGLLVPFEEAIP